MVRAGKITVSVKSRVAYVDLIQAISDQVATLIGFDEEEVLNMGLAVREAVINAIKHGNQMDERKELRVNYAFGEEGMTVSVRDRGTGFELADVQDPTLPENLFRTSGRGLLLMKTFVDRVEVRRIDERGTEVSLTKLVGEPTAKRRRE